MIITKKDLDQLLNCQSAQPHALLGMHGITHEGRRGLVVRALIQDAVTCEVVDPQAEPELRFPMEKINALGVFEGFIP